MVAGDWQPHVPAATVGRPNFHGAVVGLPDVVGPLLNARDGTLVVLTAPAVYGKTTAVRLGDEVDERPFAWLRIDHLDDDPAHLLLHIATAVAGVHPLDRDVLRYLRGPGRSPLTDLVPALVRAPEHCGPLVIVLDDIDALSDPTAPDTLRALVDTAPQATTVALLGRRPPPLELALRRLLNTVVEIGIGELKLSGEQATAAFKAVSGSAGEGAARAVHDKCEGWRPVSCWRRVRFATVPTSTCSPGGIDSSRTFFSKRCWLNSIPRRRRFSWSRRFSTRSVPHS